MSTEILKTNNRLEQSTELILCFKCKEYKPKNIFVKDICKHCYIKKQERLKEINECYRDYDKFLYKEHMRVFKEEYEFQKINKIKKKIKIKLTKIPLKIKVLERDNYKCVLCDIKETIFHIHYIIPKSMAPKLIYKETNLVTLCKKCHKKTHGTSSRDIDYIITEQHICQTITS